jgi:peptidoglycan/LPS O-acetylase OafA/YrhL
MYWLAVVLATLVSARVPAQLLWGLPYLVFANALGVTVHPLLPHSIPWWSLATEVQFYLLLPVVGLLLRSRAGRVALGALVVGWAVFYGAVLGRLITPFTPTGKIMLTSSIVGRAPLFGLGMLAAWLHLRWGARLRRRLGASRLARAGACDLLLVALVLAGGALLGWVVFLGIGRVFIGFRPLWHAGAGICMTAILLVLLLAPLRLRPLFVNPLLARIGVVSYSLFLIHLWPLAIVLGLFGFSGQPADGWTPKAALAAALALAVCLGLAALGYRFVERPFLERKARVA